MAIRDGLPAVLHEGLCVRVVPPEIGLSRSLVVAQVETSATAHMVLFENVKDLNQARKYVGKTLLADTTDLPADFYRHDFESLIGRVVEDEQLGLLGQIVQVSSSFAQDVWHIQHDDKELLFPAAGELIVSCEPTGPIVVRLPKGLIEKS